MARMTVDPECPHVVRRVRRLIENHMGSEAAAVFSEAMANVREHGGPSHAELMLHSAGFEVRNERRGQFRRYSRKPCGEGGYGRAIMEQFGASLNTGPHRFYVTWCKAVQDSAFE
ncbi:MAG TPA: hypothetical protein VGM51_13460 [Armatimonadota bacterium]|jgi:hypothetical protein